MYSLADASEEEVLKLWQGLGYYSRARNLHHAARTVVKDFGGRFPADYLGLLNLKGVGEYTAAAIASIAYNEAVPVVDGNVARVLARLYALDQPVDSPSGYKFLKQIAGELIPISDAATFNQAIMEFGALQCKPKNPDCETCPLRLNCQAYGTKRVSVYPKKLNRTKVKELNFYYFVITFPVNGEDHILLHRRAQSGIWRNMYDFPLLESVSAIEFNTILQSETVTAILGNQPVENVSFSSEYIHQLSHRRITARFIRISQTRFPVNPGPNLVIPVSSIGEYPIPRLIERYLEANEML